MSTENKLVVRENSKLISVHFESAIDLLEHDERGMNSIEFKSYTHRTKTGRDYKWFGNSNKNAGDVIDHALVGDKDLYESLINKVRDLRSMEGMDKVDYVQRIKSVRRKLVHGNFGDELDIHKVYAGKIETAWSSRVREEFDKEHHLVTLFIDIAGNAKVNCEDSLWRAVVAMKVFEDLERAGKSVRIIAGGSSFGVWQKDNRNCAVSIVIKEYNQSLSLERLAAMSHVGFYRVFGFAAKCAQDIRRPMYNLGMSMDSTVSNVSINLQEDIAKGHTKLVFIGRSLSRYDAHRDLDAVYKQLQAKKEVA
jgi:hypothetical protein